MGFDLKGLLEAIVHTAADLLGDGCLIRLLSEDGLLVVEAAHHGNPEALKLLWEAAVPVRVGEEAAGRAAQTRDGLLFSAQSREEARRILGGYYESYLARFHIHSAMAAPMIAGGQLIGTIALFRDISPEPLGRDDHALLRDLATRGAQAVVHARLYEEAQEAIRARDEFLSIASHELKTPLTAAELQLQMLARLLRDLPEGPQKLLSKLERQQGRLEGLINELLDVARIRSGRLELRKEKGVDLGRIASDVVERLREDAARAGCTVTVDAKEPIVGEWDPMRIEQVVTNLLTNAFKFGGGKPVEVMVARRDSTACLRVRDHGIGIPPEEHARVFERFERAVSSRTYGGLGLGLYIVRQIVEVHGGSIRVESTAGEGSTFIVELPIS